MSDLYDDDILAWSEHQSELLRRLAAGEQVNEEIDWPNIIDEIDSVGRNELHQTRSLLVQALRHKLKMMAWPNSSEVPHWEEEFFVFQFEASQAYQSSMRQKLDMAWIYRRARLRFPKQIDGRPPLPLPETCPVTLDELLEQIVADCPQAAT